MFIKIANQRSVCFVYKSVDILGLEGSRLYYEFCSFFVFFVRFPLLFLGSSFRSKNKPFMLAVRPSIHQPRSVYVQTNWNRLHSCETYDKCHFDYNNRFYWTTHFEWKWSNYIVKEEQRYSSILLRFRCDCRGWLRRAYGALANSQVDMLDACSRGVTAHNKP